MLGEAVESCQARRPRASTNAAQRQKRPRSQSDGAALGVLPRCADEDSPPGLSVAGAPCNYPQWRSHIRDRIYEFEYLVAEVICTKADSPLNLWSSEAATKGMS